MVNKYIVYGFGIVGRYVANNLNVAFIIDTDIKKVGSSYNGIQVKSPKFFESEDLSKYTILVTVVDIFDVIPLLDKFGCKNYISLYELYHSNPNIFDGYHNGTQESDTFVKYSLDTVLECQKAYHLNQIYLRSVDLVITERCSLKCRDCANLMQYYEKPNNIDTEAIMNGLQNLASKCNFINEVRLIGGEPFLNKNVYSIIDGVTKISNIRRIVVYTNATVPLAGDKLIELDLSKVVFSITQYNNYDKNLNRVVDVLKELSIPYRVHPPEHWTDSGRILPERHSKEFADELFVKCCGKNLFTLIGSDLYRCPFAANAENLDAIPVSETNSLDVNTLNPVGFMRFLKSGYAMDACFYCPGRSFDATEIEPAVQVKRAIPYIKIINQDKT